MGGTISCCSDTDHAANGEVSKETAETVEVKVETALRPLPSLQESDKGPEESLEVAPMWSKWSRMEERRILEVDASILRGIPLKASLRSFGRLWQRSPLDLPEQERMALYDRSVPVESFDVFLSHTWLSSGTYKALSLMFQAGWWQMLLCQSLCAAAVAVLGLLGLMPMPLVLPPRFDHAPDTTYPYFPWCFIASFVGLCLGALLLPYFPDRGRRSTMCFFDVVSINQVDQELMERGIYGLGGCLRVSRELRVLWSAPYFSRLWCVFELAAYHKASPSGRIVLTPLYIEVGFMLSLLGTYLASGLFLVIHFMGSEGLGQLLVVCTSFAPLLFLIHMLRRNNMAKQRLISDLKTFNLDQAHCRTDFDRQFITRAIVEWYGSEEAFTQFVRGPLREELLCSQCNFPAQYVLMMSFCVFCAGLDSLVALWLGGVDAYWLWSEFLGFVVGYYLGWLTADVQLAICLCEWFAAPIFSGLLDYVQSFVLFIIFAGLFYIGRIVGQLAYKASLWGGLAFACGAGAFALLVFWMDRYQRQRRMRG